MPRLTTLKPRLKASGGRVMPVLGRIGATPRQRGSGWMKRRAEWLSANPLCVACDAQGRVSAATEVDHITPLCVGGADDESNLQSLCTACHASKTAGEAKQLGRG